MSTPRRLTIPTLVLLGALALPAFVPGPVSVDPNRERLQSMPLERRRELAEKLDAFDRLDPAQKERLRQLDQKISEQSEGERENDLAILKRYHLWVQGLSDLERNKLLATSPEARLALVTTLRNAQRTAEHRNPLFLQLVDFGRNSPFNLAQRIKVYLGLSPEEREEVDRLPANERPKRLLADQQRLKIGRLNRPSRDELDAVYERAIQSNRFPFLNRLDESIKTLGSRRPSDTRKSEGARKSEDAAKKEQERFRQRLADHYYLTQHPPEKVSPEKLLAFERALPPWLQSHSLSLPPGEARRRLTVLYRLCFPPGQEFASSPARPLSAKRPPSTPARVPPPVSTPAAPPTPY